MTKAKTETVKRKRSDLEGFTRGKRAKSDLSNQKTDNTDLMRLRVLLSVAGPLAIDDIAQIAVKRDSDDSVECVELLSRDTRVDWNRRNESGDTPLMYCIKNNKTEMVEIIGGVSGIRNTVTQSGVSFMRDLIGKIRDSIEKEKKKLYKLECQFEEEPHVKLKISEEHKRNDEESKEDSVNST